LGLVAMPFGLDGVFWQTMGIGIDWMIAVTQWVAGLPGAIGRMAAFGIGPVIAASVGIILLGLLRTPLRWSGAAALVLAVAWALAVPQPDILVSGDGHNVGVRGKDGRLHLMRTAKDGFLLKEWLAADADGRQPTDASLAEGVSCDEAGCVTQMADGAFVALALRPDALTDDCDRAALVVTARQASPSCPSPVIDQDRLRSQGPIALRRTRAGFAVDAVRPRGVDRPWSPAAASGCDASGSRPADGRLRGRIATVMDAGRMILPAKAASLLVERRIFLQFECAETKFLAGIRRCCRLNQRKRRVREPLPDRKVFRRNREPTECEHVPARFGHVSRLLPSDLIDHRSVFPSEPCN